MPWPADVSGQVCGRGFSEVTQAPELPSASCRRSGQPSRAGGGPAPDAPFPAPSTPSKALICGNSGLGGQARRVPSGWGPRPALAAHRALPTAPQAQDTGGGGLKFIHSFIPSVGHSDPLHSEPPLCLALGTELGTRRREIARKVPARVCISCRLVIAVVIPSPNSTSRTESGWFLFLQAALQTGAASFNPQPPNSPGRKSFLESDLQPAGFNSLSFPLQLPAFPVPLSDLNSSPPPPVSTLPLLSPEPAIHNRDHPRAV